MATNKPPEPTTQPAQGQASVNPGTFKKGEKRPGQGRPKGAINKRTEALVREAEKGGLLPVPYMLQVLRAPEPVRLDGESVESYLARLEKHEERRMWASEKAAPYLHPKLSAIEHRGKDGAELIPRALHVYFPTPGS